MIKLLTGSFDDSAGADMAYENLKEAEYKPHKPQLKDNQTTVNVPVEDVSEDAAREILKDHRAVKIYFENEK